MKTCLQIQNYLSGTPEERGILAWNNQLPVNKENTPQEKKDSKTKATAKCYDLPFCMPSLRRQGWTRYVPVCPTFVSCLTKSNDDERGYVISKENEVHGDIGMQIDISEM